ncbi:hypothetical protein J6590_077450 [Homalodisca vitripennis]|nr:hypothetical protein J6590_077450 [Homalodisca vitripennis]
MEGAESLNPAPRSAQEEDKEEHVKSRASQMRSSPVLGTVRINPGLIQLRPTNRLIIAHKAAKPPEPRDCGRFDCRPRVLTMRTLIFSPGFNQILITAF